MATISTSRIAGWCNPHCTRTGEPPTTDLRKEGALVRGFARCRAGHTAFVLQAGFIVELLRLHVVSESALLFRSDGSPRFLTDATRHMESCVWGFLFAKSYLDEDVSHCRHLGIHSGWCRSKLLSNSVTHSGLVY